MDAESAAVLRADSITKRFTRTGDPAVNEVSLAVAAGEIVSLVGESGCGKTTTLRIIAGFETPDAGEVWIDGARATSGRDALPPNERPTGIVFQEHALFPHLTVEQNIAFGLRGVSRAQRDARVQELLELAELPQLRRRYPHQLSGGQGQRVALARALAPKPEVILLDEPFNNVDVGLRFRLLRDVERLIRSHGTAAILVTHDWKEAFTISDRVAVMSRGAIRRVGAPQEVYEQPRSRFVAEFFGPVNDLPREPSHLRRRAVRPRDVRVRASENVDGADAGSERYAGTVESRRFMGEYQEVACRVESGDGTLSITAYTPTHASLEPGRRVVVWWPRENVLYFEE